MSAEKAAVARFFEGFTGQRDVNAAVEPFAAGAVIHQDAMPGPLDVAGYQQVGAMFLAAFSDLNATIEEQFVDGNTVITRVTWSGTNDGSFAGMPATNRSFQAPGILIDRFAAGKIVERWNVGDQLSMMMQLGVIPAPGGA